MKTTVSPLSVTGPDGVSHPVLAAKLRNATHPQDPQMFLVIRPWDNPRTPFVVHTFNAQDGGFYWGTYCDSLERAFEVFNSKS